ncbi:MAG: hypothetical protein V4558_16045 [Gemmatimonadota bacterium]
MSNGTRAGLFRINLLLVVLGAVAGALAGIPLTWLGKIISGAPEPATLATYLWNARAMAVMGAVFAPLLAWSTMRRVPLWRAALETAAGGLVGAIIGMMLASGGLMLFLAGAGISLSAWRLNRAYPERMRVGDGNADETPAIGA